MWARVPDSDANPEVLPASGSNARSYKGETPLHQAAALGQTRRVSQILATGVDPNARADGGQMPLHLAASQGHTETVRTLLDAGADPTARADGGQMPMHLAASQGHTEIVLALEPYASLNTRSGLGQTPLHLAASQGHTETVRTLLDIGADPTATCARGQTPLDLAQSKGYAEAVRALTEAGRNNGDGNQGGRHGPERKPEDAPQTEDDAPAVNIPEPTGSDVAVTVANMGSRQSDRPGLSRLRGSVRNRLGPLNRNRLGPLKEKDMPTVSIIGEPGSGKSHFGTLLYIHLQTNSELDVYCDFENVEWNTINNADRLVRGIPLEPTPSDTMIHDVLRVRWSETVTKGIGPWSREETSTKEVKIPIIDSAGELLQIAMGDIFRTSGRISLRELEQHIADRDYDAQLVTTLYNDVFRADRFCFIVDAARGLNRRRGTSAQVKHAAFLQNLKNFREANKLPPILDSMLVFTKYDAARSRIEEFLIRNGADPGGTTVANYQAPQLMAQLTSLQGGSDQGGNRANPVNVVLSSTEWQQPPMTESEIQEKYGNGITEDDKMDFLEGQFEVRLLENGNPIPVYNEEEYEKIVAWLKAML